MPFDPATLGFPVELAKIPQELKKLWAADGDTKTRASLINFAVYTEGTEAFAANTHLIEEFVRDHACRAILVGYCPRVTPPKISAWIQAHCHLTKAGAKQICSEQVTLLAEGVSEEGVANALLANLDYDLPLNLWWHPEFPESASSPIWNRIDRLIFDSTNWKDRSEQLHRLHLLKAHSANRMALSDLNWTRSLAIRQAVAQCFDNPVLLAEIPAIHRIEIRHLAGFESTAQLLACWFGAQFGWNVSAHTQDSIQFQSSAGTFIECRFVASSSAGIALSSLTIVSANATLTLDREMGSALLHSRLQDSTGVSESHFSAGAESVKGLLSEEMNPGLRHKVYLKALALLQTIF